MIKLEKLTEDEYTELRYRCSNMFDRKGSKREKSSYKSFIHYYNNLKNQGKDVSKFDEHINFYNTGLHFNLPKHL